MFGSVPLRTVLPDGDIDISVFCPPSVSGGGMRETWAMELLRALEREQVAPSQQLFTVSDVHYIQAEVRGCSRTLVFGVRWSSGRVGEQLLTASGVHYTRAEVHGWK